MSSDEADLRRYAGEIERAWDELSDRPIVLSPRDFRLLADWFEREIPLELIREALGEARARRRDARAPQRLSTVAAIVEESWTTFVEGRVARIEPSPSTATLESTPTSAVSAWRSRAASPATAPRVRERLELLLAELDAGADPARIDATLEAELGDLLAPAILAELRRSVDERMGPYRDRLDAQAFAAAHSRALRAAQRRALGLPRLGPTADESQA